ncbi:MAG: hypothetical protein PF485_05930 [Bacteroidales bacterium]|jgi:hypothetical protein|nr:hypothetical protein [Bacteroidales bacterium]
MKKVIIICLSLLVNFQFGYSQGIEKMLWDKDFQIHITLANDSNYILDIKELHHTEVAEDGSSSFTYLPTRLENDFVNKLKQTEVDTNSLDQVDFLNSNKTLWSALHSSIGGGWVHFVNCLLYSLETAYLDIDAPLMKRPESKWKPRPKTESYKRTKKWEYYVPVDQKLAIREYKIKKTGNNLGYINDVPHEFINLFLSIKQSEYEQMNFNYRKRDKAKIDMIKILVGANYLGETQIKYIKSMVLKSMVDYAENQLPSVIIFDNFNAAVAMSLNETGYQVDKIVFADERFISLETRLERVNQINLIVNQINKVNKEVFQQKLKSYYN